MSATAQRAPARSAFPRNIAPHDTKTPQDLIAEIRRMGETDPGTGLGLSPYAPMFGALTAHHDTLWHAYQDLLRKLRTLTFEHNSLVADIDEAVDEGLFDPSLLDAPLTLRIWPSDLPVPVAELVAGKLNEWLAESEVR